MIESLSDILIVSDIDGTLLREETGLSEKNIDAVKRFTDKGGRFTVSTGRAIEITRHLINGLSVNAPSIHINGGYLYDWSTDSIIDPIYISDNARYICSKIVRRFPFCDCHFADSYAVNLVTSGDTLRKYIDNSEIRLFENGFEGIGGNVFKFIICSDPEEMSEVRLYAESICDRNIQIIQSSPFFLEILPKNTSKSAALRKLCELTGVPIENTVAVGDYENDLDMIKAAGIGCAVENAQECVKREADIVLPACEENAISELIDLLEEMYGD